MNREELIHQIAEAIATMEGYYLTKRPFKPGNKFPTRARRLGNPGMIRRWKDKYGRPYPQKDGFVDFIEWARQFQTNWLNYYEAGHQEGWRVLRKLISFYIDGRYHDGKSPNLYEMFEKYAPVSDANDPKKYAEFVAKKVGIDPKKPLKEVVEDDRETV